MISGLELVQALKERGRDLGFPLVGVAVAARPETYDLFRDWLKQGLHGEMGYLARREAAYEDSSGVLPGVRTIIMAAMEYGSGRTVPDGSGRIAAYAQGTVDYHDLVRIKLKELAAVIHEHRPGTRSRVTVDTAPLLERDVARRAGLGWFGKNTMLINKYIGSYFILGGILTDCELPPDPRHDASHCGTCTRCLEACPTDAFNAPYVLDARKCISYLTIELRGQPIPRPLRSGMQDWMFGCDVCQQVCPWNRKAGAPSMPELLPSPITARSACEFLSMTEEEFHSLYSSTPFSRPGWENMARNAAIVLGNFRSEQFVPVLSQRLQHPSPLVRGAVVWALGQIGTPEARTILQNQLDQESDSLVRDELQSALDSHSMSVPLSS